jgi:two-component system, OmpR family, response regulator
MRVLIVEDDEKIASFILKGLKENGFAVDQAGNGEDGLHMALTEPYDAAIIDIMLPKLDGLTLIKEMRKKNIKTPVIILSARGTIDDRVKGLHAGGDDYLTKPFAFTELLARVQSLIRRSSGIAEPTSLSVHDIYMDFLGRKVTRAGKKIELTSLEFALLEYLIRNVNTVISKTMIMEHIWKYNFDPQTNVVDVLVCGVRNKIDRDFGEKLIHTLRGAGYILKTSEL